MSVLNNTLIDIINKGECITTEFKEAKTKLNRDVYESVCGFLNRLGGHLFLGVKDDKTIVGVDETCVEQIKKGFCYIYKQSTEIGASNICDS